MRRTFNCVFAMILALSLCAAAGQAYERPFTEGTVWNITFVRIMEGMEDSYLEELKNHFKPFLEEAIKEELILSYRILSSPASTTEDWDLMLMIEYKNMAAFDGLDEKFIALYERVVGTEEDYEKGALRRNEIREIIGDKLAREVILK